MNLTFTCVDYDSINNVCNSTQWVETPASLLVDDPAVGNLISAVALLFATAFIFNFLIKFILNKF